MDVNDAKSLETKITESLKSNVGEDGNVVLSLFSDAKDSPVIHIVDVLVAAKNKDVKGFDESWISYLDPTIQQNNTNIDLFFNIVPGDTTEVEQTNKNLLQLSYRLVQFLNAFRLSGRR
jgi:hypothetical protein